MTTWALLAPGPSASKALADRLLGFKVGAIGNAYQLAPWAEFLAATDGGWWRKHPDAKEFAGDKYAMHGVSGVELVRIPPIGICNSGVLGLEVAKSKGAKRILLCGFDMHGSHFFGQYTNGLRNTSPGQREQHKKQFKAWAFANRKVEVINCTEGSALTCFPVARLEEFIETGVPESAADECRPRGVVCAGAAA